MIRITDLVLPFDHDENDLRLAVLKTLDIEAGQLKSIEIGRSSLDARKKHAIRRVYTLQIKIADEKQVLESYEKNQKISLAPETKYNSPILIRKIKRHRPLVVGTGPAGLFAGLVLAEAGYPPLLIDRGKQVEERNQDTNKFWKNRELNSESNVQFGEGGAGTFSDGKLQTRVKDKLYRDKKVLQELVLAGAPEEILYKNKPHLGTAKLTKIVENIRAKIIRLGGEYQFQSRMDDLILEEYQIVGVRLQSGEEIRSDHVILAIGHSARDTFEMLSSRGVHLEAKPFSVGFRIEHPQVVIDRSQYGQQAGHPLLGAADYQLAHHSSLGRTVYSFCMCPGGLVIGAASEPGTVVTNGMSQYARNEMNANSAIVAEVIPADFMDEPLGGIEFQRQWEEKAFLQGGENFNAPCQLVGDFLSGKRSSELGSVQPSYLPGIKMADLRESLPGFVVAAIQEALPEFDKRIRGFTQPDAVLTGVETRTSSPVRIVRGKDYQSISIQGLYPAGEGSGYAGGILSSAMDGIKAAEAIIKQLNGDE
ncbi:MAG: NAD(P)/FAD-dependent oxidoreductase [Anaerolineales bacterium]|nr:NAD(P)/FAD-dependent oxidoreductase [Anaerolineales bacterium]